MHFKGCGVGGRICDFDGFAARALKPFVLVEILECARRSATIGEKVRKRHLVALAHGFINNVWVYECDQLREGRGLRDVAWGPKAHVTLGVSASLGSALA